MVINPQHATDEPAPKRLRLTEGNLRRQQRLQRHSSGSDEASQPRRAPSSTSKTTVVLTDTQFAAKLIEKGVVYEPFETEPPDDLKQIKAALLKPQTLPSQAHRYWGKICVAKKHMSQGELSLESMIVESMLWHHDSPKNYQRHRHDQWTEVENEITAGISDPKPGVTEAHLCSAYPPGTREDLEELFPTQYGYAMPTFAMESKGPSGDHEQAVKQAAYDGAVMTHAALAIDGHVGKSRDSQLRKTKAITVTLSPVEINVYANHAISEESGKRCSYHQYCVMTVRYIESEEEWNRAHNMIYNAQEIAMELAESRVQAIWGHYEDGKKKLEQMKVKEAELRDQARAKTIAAMATPHSKRKRIRAKPPKGRNELWMKAQAVITPPSSRDDTGASKSSVKLT